ncbi:30S ribosomal protein S13 [Candidatus Roizmanbacteria bacterium]|nr:30S ribosomal protein S13 [Candidatus Roizmanbacteria bacterium]
MIRLSGVDLPEQQLIQFAMTSLFGIGRNNAKVVLRKAEVEAGKRVKELTEEEVARIQQVLDKEFVVEGDLRRVIAENIGRLKTIGAYRGTRHSKGLPARGQRTRSNARTKRGKRKTVGAMKKEDRVKTDQPDQQVKK